MIIVLRPTATEADAREILDRIASVDLKPLHMPGVERTVIGALGDERKLGACTSRVILRSSGWTPSWRPTKLSIGRCIPKAAVSAWVISRSGALRSGLWVGPVRWRAARSSGRRLVREKAGAHALRGGAFKPRTSPYSFQGLGEEGLKILAEVSAECGLPTLTEVVEVADVDLVARYADAFQVGARNMQNFRLLQALGRQAKPVLLKRGMSATIDDTLMSAEYIASEGNTQIILCERGIRTFEPGTRNTLDLSAVCQLKEKSHLPVVVDPSHGTGVRSYVAPMAFAAVAAGADGVLIETHINPAEALSDGAQSLFPGPVQ
jgi:3-deoxy-7-phosphoheptulonate synthase